MYCLLPNDYGLEAIRKAVGWRRVRRRPTMICLIPVGLRGLDPPYHRFSDSLLLPTSRCLLLEIIRPAQGVILRPVAEEGRDLIDNDPLLVGTQFRVDR